MSATSQKETPSPSPGLERSIHQLPVGATASVDVVATVMIGLALMLGGIALVIGLRRRQQGELPA